jgi:multidrug efflux pump subunit AcrB
MNVSAWSIRNPIPAVMLFVMLTLAGLLGFRAMKIQQFPDIDLPTINVTASLPGMAPAQMETEVARKIENAVASLQSVKNIYTKVQDGVAIVTVEFRLEKPTQEALDDVRSAVSRVRADLPADLKDPVISKLDLAGSPILTYTVASSRMDDEALSWFVDNEVTKSMLAVRGVGSVARVGGVTREVRVELDPARLLALNATAADVSRQLRAVQQDAASGRADVGGIEQSVRTIATVKSAEELARLEVALSDGRRLRLDQVATVSDTVAEQRSGALLNGRPVVSFEVVRSRGAGETDVADGVRAALDKLRAEHPDVDVTEAFNFVDPVVENYEGSMTLLLEGAVLAVIVVFLFLRDWRATLVAATALPLSIIPAFAVMHYMLGFTLNVVTLLSMSLVVGILVDDAIVEIENIMRHLRMGKTPYEAAMEAADEIGLAVIATTFTLIAVFLPTAFMGGVAGKFFVQFGWTAAIAVFFSLVVARALTPMMAAYILKPPKKAHHEPGWLTHYLGWARWCLRHRVLTMLATAVFFCRLLHAGAAAADRLHAARRPEPDAGDGDPATRQHLQPDPGGGRAGTLHRAEERTRQARLHGRGWRRHRGRQLHARRWPARCAQGHAHHQHDTPQRPPGPDQAGHRVAVARGPGRVAWCPREGGLSARAPRSTCWCWPALTAPRLTAHAAVVERELRGIPGIGAVTSSSSLVRPELIVRPDAARAADLGVTAAAIADTLRIATSGDFDQALPKLNLSQRQVPIVVRLPASARADLKLLERLPVPGKHGPVALGNVATLAIDSGPAEIDRYNRQRNVNFEIELNQQPLGEVKDAALALPSLKNLPPGVIQTEVGDAEAMGELFESFGLAMLTGVAVHLHRAGAAVQGLCAAGHHPGRAGAVGAGCVSGAVCVADGACPCPA